MHEGLYLNNEVAEITGITQRQAQSWSDKGLVIPAREARGGGSKRGYDYLNLIEFGLCRKLFEMGLGVQSVKAILGIIREEDLLTDWLGDPREFFRREWTKGVFGHFFEAADNRAVEAEKNLQRSLQHLFIYEQLDEKLTGTGVLVYFFDGVLKGRAFILPRIKFSLDESTPKVAKAVEYIYHVLTSGEMLNVNLGSLKRSIDEIIARI